MATTNTVRESRIILEWDAPRKHRHIAKVAGLPKNLRVRVEVVVESRQEFEFPFTVVAEGVARDYFERVEALVRGA